MINLTHSRENTVMHTVDYTSLRVIMVASGKAYQKAAAWAASTYTLALPPNAVSVLIPEGEVPSKIMLSHAQRFGFGVGGFPLTLTSQQKFTSQLKCQAFYFAVSKLSIGQTVLLVDADTCCLGKLSIPCQINELILAGNIGMVRDPHDFHSNDNSEPWYLSPNERLTYVNSGVVMASLRTLDMFQRFWDLSREPGFLRGPFNDQKVINFAMGRYFRDRLVLLDCGYNMTRRSIIKRATIPLIRHFIGGAGKLGRQRRKKAHKRLCLEMIEALQSSR